MPSRDPATDKLVAPPDFQGPTESERHCTDVFCGLLLVISWALLTGIGLYALREGDYRLVLNPMDYNGNICGTDFADDLKDYPYLLFVNKWTGGVCVKECPNLYNQTADDLTDIRTLVTYAGMWQPSTSTPGPELPLDFVQVYPNYSQYEDAIKCTDELCFPNDSPTESWTSDGIRRGSGYAYYVTDTVEALHRCYVTRAASDRLADLVKKNESDVEDDIDKSLDAIYGYWTNLFADVWTARRYILGFGIGVSLLVSCVYIFLMRLPLVLRTLVWTSIFLTIAILIGGGWSLITIARDWSEDDPRPVGNRIIYGTRAFGAILVGLGVIFAAIVCCLRQAISIAISCVKEAGIAVNSMVLLLFMPFIQAFGYIVFLVVFIVYAVHLVSLGDIETKQAPIDLPNETEFTYKTYSFDDNIKKWAWYMLFCLFWTSNFIVAVGDMIVAMSVAKWYFTRNKLTIGSWTVVKSMIDTLWYHFGTCAYGSLVLAIIQLIRAIIARAQKHAKDTKNKILQYLLCCCQCFFWCLEKCLKFLNKNAYIQTAIFSTSFCHSCREAFYLIVRNAARVAAVTFISSLVLIIGKICISVVTTVLGYIVIVDALGDELNAVGGPVAIIFLTSYWMSDFFLNIFDMAITTILHCFVADEEMFPRDQAYAHASLRKFIDKHATEKNLAAAS